MENDTRHEMEISVSHSPLNDAIEASGLNEASAGLVLDTKSKDSDAGNAKVSVCGIDGCSHEVKEGIRKAIHLRNAHFDVYREIYQPANYGQPQTKRRKEKECNSTNVLVMPEPSPNSIFKSAFLERKRIKTMNENKRTGRRAPASSNRDEIQEIELNAEEDEPKTKIVSDVVMNPCFDEVGMAMTFFDQVDLELIHDERADRYTCPIRHCVKQYTTSSGALYHMSKSTCQANPDITSRVEAHNKKMQEDIDNMNFKIPSHLQIRSEPSFPQYKWPQDDANGEWWVPLIFAKRFFPVKNILEEHPELTWRFAEIPEKLILRKKNLIKQKALYRDLPVVIVDEVLLLIENFYPERLSDCLKLVESDKASKIGNQPFSQIDVSLQHSIAKPIALLTNNYNKALAYERREERRSYFDVFTQITHYPSSTIQRVEKPRKTHVAYPIALTPGQFQQGYKIWSHKEEAEYLNPTPLPPPPKHVGMTVEDLLAAASTTNVGNQKAKSSPHPCANLALAWKSRLQKLIKDRPIVMRPPLPGSVCAICLRGRDSNAEGIPEELVTCSKCETCGHPSCLELSPELVSVVKTYKWECMECKLCTICFDPNDEHLLLFCDECDRGYHTYCVGLSETPKGRWMCNSCGFCTSCGVQAPGKNSQTNGNKSVPKPDVSDSKSTPIQPAFNWHYIYDGNPEVDISQRNLLATLCSSCNKFFDVGMFCPICLCTYKNNKEDSPMLQCHSCNRWIHSRCDNIKDEAVSDFLMDPSNTYSCGICKGEIPDRCNKFSKKKPHLRVE